MPWTTWKRNFPKIPCWTASPSPGASRSARRRRARSWRGARARGALNVWTYTGYTYEKLLDMAASDPDVAALLDATDVLVDGPFVLSERSLELDFCGSRNQRLIDLAKTRAAGEIVRYTPPEW